MFGFPRHTVELEFKVFNFGEDEEKLFFKAFKMGFVPQIGSNMRLRDFNYAPRLVSNVTHVVQPHRGRLIERHVIRFEDSLGIEEVMRLMSGLGWEFRTIYNTREP